MTEDEAITQHMSPEDLNALESEDSNTPIIAHIEEDVNGNNNSLLLSSPDATISLSNPRPPVPFKPPDLVDNREQGEVESDRGNGLLNLNDSGVETLEQSEKEVKDLNQFDAVKHHSEEEEGDVADNSVDESIDILSCDSAEFNITSTHSFELNGNTHEESAEEAKSVNQDQNSFLRDEPAADPVRLERGVSDDGIKDYFESENTTSLSSTRKSDIVNGIVHVSQPELNDNFVSDDKEYNIVYTNSNHSNNCSGDETFNFGVDECSSSNTIVDKDNSQEGLGEPTVSHIPQVTSEQNLETEEKSDIEPDDLSEREKTEGDTVDDTEIAANETFAKNAQSIETVSDTVDETQSNTGDTTEVAASETFAENIQSIETASDKVEETQSNRIDATEVAAHNTCAENNQSLATVSDKVEETQSDTGDLTEVAANETFAENKQSIETVSDKVEEIQSDTVDPTGVAANETFAENYQNVETVSDKVEETQSDRIDATEVAAHNTCAEDHHSLETVIDKVEETQSDTGDLTEVAANETFAENKQSIETVSDKVEVTQSDTGDSTEVAANETFAENAQSIGTVSDKVEETQSNTGDTTEVAASETFAESYQSFETVEQTEDIRSLKPNPEDWEYSALFLSDQSYHSDSEVEMGRRSLSFKRKTPHMVYTEEEFKEHYTTIDKGKSLDSSSKQDVKRGFQRLKAEKGGRPLRHTRSLSTPAAESFSGGPPPRSKGRPTSMMERGTDTSEYFKDHEDREANIRIRGLMSPNETNNNKNIDSKSPAPLQIDVKAELEIKPHKTQNVNAGKPRSPRTPTFPVDGPPRGPLTVQDLTVMSGYPDKKVGVTKPIMAEQNRLNLTKHINKDNVDAEINGNHKSPKNVNADVRKTEIAAERQMILKQAIKGSVGDDKLSPRATGPSWEKPPNGSISPMSDEVSRTVQRSESRTPPPIAPKPSVQRPGPLMVTTRIVDGEEELTIGSVPMPSRPQSAPVMQMTSGSRPRHFACIEPVGQPVMGHPPRISQIEPVLVSPMKRAQQQQSYNPLSHSTETTEIIGSSNGRDENIPDSLSAMMSVTVTSSTMPELQKPELTRVDSVEDAVANEAPKNEPPPAEINDDVIVPQTELVVESKKEFILEAEETKVSPQVEGTETKSTSPLSETSSPVAEIQTQPVPEIKTRNGNKTRFPFPSISKSKSIEVNDLDDDDDEHGIYDASFRNSGWIYIGGNQELQMITGPVQPHQPKNRNEKPDPKSIVVKAQVESKPSKKNKKKEAENEEEVEHIVDEVFSREDPARESVGTTASEEEFKKQYQSVALRRIQRKQSIMDYQRLSLIAREREVIVVKENNLFGFRIQYSKPVVVTDIDQGGAAEKAGLKVGDMVLKVNGQDVTQSAHSHVVKLAAAGPDTLELLVGTNVCNTLNLEAMKPVMSGHLWKLGSSGVFSNWKKRWFVLKQDNVLYYYKTKEDAEPLGAIVLCNYTVVKARDVGKSNAFKLTKHKARTFHMYSTTTEEMNSWAKAITEAARPNSKADIWLDISTHNVSVPALSIKYPDCHGILTKMGGRRKTWKRRYCVLKDACLYYYKDIDAPQALGVAHFHGYSIQETEIGSKKYAFILKPPEETLRTFYFIADHETDRKRWVAAFAYSIGRWIQTNTGDDSDEESNEMLI